MDVMRGMCFRRALGDLCEWYPGNVFLFRLQFDGAPSSHNKCNVLIVSLRALKYFPFAMANSRSFELQAASQE